MSALFRLSPVAALAWDLSRRGGGRWCVASTEGLRELPVGVPWVVRGTVFGAVDLLALSSNSNSNCTGPRAFIYKPKGFHL